MAARLLTISHTHTYTRAHSDAHTSGQRSSVFVKVFGAIDETEGCYCLTCACSGNNINSNNNGHLKV